MIENSDGVGRIENSDGVGMIENRNLLIQYIHTYDDVIYCRLQLFIAFIELLILSSMHAHCCSSLVYVFARVY